MVDGEGEQAPAVGAGPVGGEAQQGDGIAAAGPGEGDRAPGVPLKARAQPFADAAKPGRDDPGRGGGAQPALRAAGQANCVRRAAARDRAAAVTPAA